MTGGRPTGRSIALQVGGAVVMAALLAGSWLVLTLTSFLTSYCTGGPGRWEVLQLRYMQIVCGVTCALTALLWARLSRGSRVAVGCWATVGVAALLVGLVRAVSVEPEFWCLF